MPLAELHFAPLRLVKESISPSCTHRLIDSPDSAEMENPLIAEDVFTRVRNLTLKPGVLCLKRAAAYEAIGINHEEVVLYSVLRILIRQWNLQIYQRQPTVNLHAITTLADTIT